MDKLIPVHHSLVDWNFQSGVGLAIDSARFVSPPSALRRPTGSGQGTTGNFALKVEISGNLRDGRISSYFLAEGVGLAYAIIFVRAQTSPHIPTGINSYGFRLTAGTASIGTVINSSFSPIANYSISPALAINIWHRFRFTWYTWLDAALQPILRLIVDREVSGAWVQVLFYDFPNPLYQLSSINLVGMLLYGGDAITQNWIDNTIVYRPA